MIDFTHYVSGEDIATKLTHDTEELVSCLVQLEAHFKEHPNLVAEIHSTAVEENACKALRRLGTILANMQG